MPEVADVALVVVAPELDLVAVVAPELDLVAVVAPELALLARGLSTGPGARGWVQGGQQGPGDPLHL